MISSGVMQMGPTTMGFVVENRYLIKSCKRSKVIKLHACVRFAEKKDGTLTGPKNSHKGN